VLEDYIPWLYRGAFQQELSRSEKYYLCEREEESFIIKIESFYDEMY
jgi:hypothetical protein